MIIDTHTHLYSKEFDKDRESIIQKAIASGVKRFYLPNIDSESIDIMLDLEKKMPGHCYAMMGLHPCHVNDSVDKELAIVRQWLEKRPFIAVGEIGIDLYWDKTFFEQQQKAFRTQVQWALEFEYPVSIHCRNAFDELYALLKEFPRLPKAIFHCFSGNLEQARQVLDLGNFKLGIGGVLTFKNAGLDKVVEQLSLDDLVLETDAPYLAPVPFRGKRNEPAYLPEVARRLAELKNVDYETVCMASTRNADKFL